MPHSTDRRALHLIADQLVDSIGVLVFEATQAGVEPDPLRKLQLLGLIEVMDDGGHPTIFITEAGHAALRRQPTLYDA